MQDSKVMKAALMKCLEAAYILEEDSGKIIWANEEILKSCPQAVGMVCWQALGRQKKCPFCPKLEEGQVYSWDFYQKTPPEWCKVNNYAFSVDGIRYRAGVACEINDTMRLNHDTVEELSELQKLLRENHRIKEALEHEASHDGMTGLRNRNRFNLDVAEGKYDGAGLGMLYFDLNNLKIVNDTYRHSAGDSLIKRLAEAARLTAEELSEACTYRIGGDEFVLLANATTEEELDRAAVRFREHLDRLDAGQEVACSVAVGKAYSALPCDPEQLLMTADASMYEAKRKMKGNLSK